MESGVISDAREKSIGIIGRIVKRQKEKQSGRIREVVDYETNYILAKYGKNSTHSAVPLMR
jgi:hypothetical protein